MRHARLVLLVSVMMAASILQAQAAPPTNTAAAEPAITQIRKAVTFITLVCRDGTQKFIAKGTGFFVGYSIQASPERSALFLVTNRHVALCLDDSGRALRVESVGIRMNRREAARDGIFSEDVALNEHGNVAWTVPQDNSVDLAVFRLPDIPSEGTFDYKFLPLQVFAARDVLADRRVTEGEQVLFAGFFQQFPGTKRMEPIVRQGIIAMMPSEKIPFVGRAEKVYLADLHVFHGNSGSPVFVNLGGYHNGMMLLGDDYKLIGVINAFVVEDEHLNLRLEKHVVTAASRPGTGGLRVKGTGQANSGVATIVPVDELKALLAASWPP